MALIRNIESGAVAVRATPPPGNFAELAAHEVPVALPFERPLYEPSRQVSINDVISVSEDLDVDAHALFNQFHVDPQRLASNIESVLADAEQATLADVADAFPLSQGPAEIVSYFQLATDSPSAVIDPEAAQTLSWTLPDGSLREATVEKIIFVWPS